MLNGLCRTCSNAISKKGRNPKEVMSYKEEIKLLFNWDVSRDEKEIHPTFICDSCRRKLDLFKSKKVGTTSDKLPDFQAHSEENCITCVQPSKCKVKGFAIQGVGASAKTLDQIAVANGFVVLPPNDMNVSKIYGFIEKNRSLPYVSSFVIIYLDNTWIVSVNGKELPKRHFVYEGKHSIQNNANQIFEELSKLTFCPGNDGFPQLIKAKVEADGIFKDINGNVKATIMSSNNSTIDDLKTIRVDDCELLTNSKLRCKLCTTFQKYLNICNARMSSPPSKFKADAHRSKEELIEKARQQSKEIVHLKRSVARLQETVVQMIKEEGQPVSESIEAICEQSIKSSGTSPFKKDSPMALLWEEQTKAVSLKSTKSMRWHPVMIRWCISLYLKSPGGYDGLRDSGFLVLPSRKTLDKYVSFTESKTGLNPDVLEHMVSTLPKDAETYNVGVIHDEMKIKSGIAYSKHTGKIIGFTDLGEVNNEIQEFEMKANSDNVNKPIATHVLTLLVRGINFRMQYPVAYYASTGLKGHQLYPLIWDVIRTLEFLGLKVWFVTSDGAAPNRKFFKLHGLINDTYVYWTTNPFDPTRRIYFICDVPHLVKTIRNNFANSHGHKNSRDLYLDGQQISWQHIVSLFEYDLGVNRAAAGFRQTKLTTEHVHLTSRSKMSVSLAAQVLSNSVAVALETQDNSATKSTRKFIKIMNKFFDILNVRTTSDGRRSLNDDLKPYREVTDNRIEWLSKTFIGFLDDWKRQIENIQEMPEERKAKMCLSHQTFDGLKITALSFAEMIPVLLDHGIPFILTDKFNQDPLEEHFGRQRSRLGGCDNPSLLQYGQTERKLQVAKSDSIKVMRGNTHGRKDSKQVDVNDMTPLMKKKKSK